MVGIFTMRLGVIPYLNGVPLIHGINCEIYTAVPSRLIAFAGRNDIVLGPVAAAFLDPAWRLVEGVGVGSFGAVETVKLFFKTAGISVENLKKIYLDSDSITSAGLLQVLLRHFFRRRLDEIEFVRENPKEADARLLIGDKVFEEAAQLPSIDLGEAWTRFTGLPFVYACWMTKNPELGREWKSKLVAQARQNLENLEGLAATLPLEKRAKALAYWRRLHYPLGAEEKRGIELFQKYWSELHSLSCLPLQWV